MWGCMKSEVYKGKVDIGDELLAGILCAAAHTEKHEDQHRRTTVYSHTSRKFEIF